MFRLRECRLMHVMLFPMLPRPLSAPDEEYNPKALGRAMLVGLGLCLRRGETRAVLFALHGVFHAFNLARSTPAQR